MKLSLNYPNLHPNPQFSLSANKRLSVSRDSNSPGSSPKVRSNESHSDKEKKSGKDKHKLYPPPFLVRTRHPAIMKDWSNNCPKLTEGGSATPLVPKNSKDRVRFISRLDEEGARVFAHVNASVGYLEVTPLQVRNLVITVIYDSLFLYR